MPIYKGLTKIGNINKGTTPIANVYKGAVLVYSSAKWLSYGFTNLYYSLIPTTIQSRNVLDKLRVTKVYGNSVVENQLSQNASSTQTINGITFTNNGNGSFTINGTASANASKTISGATFTNMGILNHKVLVCGNPKNSSSTTYGLGAGSGLFYYQDGIYTITADNNFTIVVKSGTAINTPITFFPMLIDLTKMFPFDTPTTLDDVRVQALLNRGYIEYNTGEIKSVDISEFSSEPFNIWDEEWFANDINDTTGEFTNIANRLCSKNYIKVIGGAIYYLNFPNSVGTYNKVYYYDNNKNYLGYENIEYAQTKLISNNCAFIRFKITANYGTTYNNNICINVSSSLNGTYKPHTQPQTLPFIYQGSGVGTSHDTFEITNSEYVFTRNVWKVDLGSLNYNLSNDTIYLYTDDLNGQIKPSLTVSEISNLLSIKYKNASFNDTIINHIAYSMNCYTISSRSRLLFANTDSYASGSDFKSAMSGVMLYYELATPQVIRIPKKHLGIVNLESLGWIYYSSGTKNRFYAQLPNSKRVSDSSVGNIYTNKYETVSWNTLNTQASDDLVALSTMTVAGEIVVVVMIHDSQYTNTTDFKNAMKGIYLFYETASEVADIEDMIKVEAGGTFTSDSDVLPNVDTVIKCK